MGCTRLQAFRKVVMPLAMPGLAATAIFAFIISWNEVFAATILTLQHRTLTAFLLSVLGESPLYFKFAGGLDRKSVVSGKSVSVRVDLGGRRIIKKKKENQQRQ